MYKDQSEKQYKAYTDEHEVNKKPTDLKINKENTTYNLINKLPINFAYLKEEFKESN